ncbi:LOW QUALITY PROTEIN: serendipity locus protein alpha [Drosophila rhopaloa]|uniref:Serendipity locus protein alpha n=1 Tax=Drosophila rhopaloa TaxID=1041015 RepID=A0A6P4F4H7_DRORH|nr:LOW QUALITY PROTEIN: serendipity locus protein alpha [Drosophila rhopaloa]
MESLLFQLNTCSELIAEGYSSTGNIGWLNEFCATFLDFASDLKARLPEVAPSGANLDVETIFLCLTQVVTCITHLERAINIEAPQMTRQHFLDRLDWCLRRLLISLTQLETNVATAKNLEDHSFVELMDLALDHLDDYMEKLAQRSNNSLHILEESFTEDSYQLASIVNHIVRHALAFANVAIKSDKKALTALCETLLSECATFHEESGDPNSGHRKLEALSLERALYALESFLNEALLHLLFVSLIELDNTSVERLKEDLQKDPEGAQELISTFDINMDRIQQIGVLAIAFSQDIKTKTIVRSCLASLESLDACIVPALQLPESVSFSHHADILQEHFNQELLIFRNVIHEIIDSCSLINNYLDMLGKSIQVQEKSHLMVIVQRGCVLVEHFRLPVNYSGLSEDGKRVHKDLILILRECQAVVSLDISVDPKRVVKRLKILYSVLAKLRDLISKDNLEPDCSVVTQGQIPCNVTRTFVRNSRSVSKRHRSFVKQSGNCSVFGPQDTFVESLNNDSDLISFQITEILRLN